MPQGTDYLRDSKEALRMMIPVVLNERNIKASAQERQKTLDALRDRYEAETLKDIERLKQEKNKAEIGIMKDLYLKANETGDQQLLNQIAPQFEGKSGVQLPKTWLSPSNETNYSLMPQKPNKESMPNTLEAVMARGMTPEQAMEAKKKLIQFQQQQEAVYKPRTAEEKMPPEVKAAMDMLKAYKETGKVDLTTALVSALPGVNPEVAAMLRQQQGNSPEKTAILEHANRIVTNYLMKQGGAAPAAPVGDDPLKLRKR